MYFVAYVKWMWEHFHNCVMVFCVPWAFYIPFKSCGPARSI
jgi:hypothetical protein